MRLREKEIKLPPVKLDHLRLLTDDRGVIQHAKYSIPNRIEGYTADDNARALIAVLKYYEIYDDPSVMDLIKIYLGCLFHMQRPDGRIHNQVGYDLRLLGDELTDSLGRVLWACSYVLETDLTASIKSLSKEIFDKALKWSFDSSSLRTKAYALMGLHYYRDAFPSDHNAYLNIDALARQLTEAYKANHSADWMWFEPYLTYANARLPQSLFVAYESTGKQELLNIARESFDFLVSLQMMHDIFVPIGNKDWYKKGGTRSLYDQQPIEASCMVEASSTAIHSTNERKYVRAAETAFRWFLGKNSKGVLLYDLQTGACFDGINPQGLNLNQGAEATISYLLARLEMEKMRRSNIM